MTWRNPLSGGVAGVATAVAFAALHELLISDIWFSVVPMAVAGAGRTIFELGSSLVTSAVLIVLLGLNVSVLGLVEMSGDSLWILAEFFALLVAMMVGFGAAFFLLERRHSFKSEPSPEDGIS